MEDFTGEVKNAINTIVDKAKEYGEIAKLQALIKAEEAKKQELYYRLGKKYYELYKNAPASDLTEVTDKLVAADEKIEELKAKLKDVQYTDVSDSAEETAEACDAAEAVDESEFVEEVTEATEEAAEVIEEATEE